MVWELPVVVNRWATHCRLSQIWMSLGKRTCCMCRVIRIESAIALWIVLLHWALRRPYHLLLVSSAWQDVSQWNIYKKPLFLHSSLVSAQEIWSVTTQTLNLTYLSADRSLGCLNPGCLMCKNTPHLRCATTFATKYLSGDPLKAKCGASIFVEVVDARGLPVTPDAVKGLHLEVCNILLTEECNQADE